MAKIIRFVIRKGAISAKLDTGLWKHYYPNREMAPISNQPKVNGINKGDK